MDIKELKKRAGINEQANVPSVGAAHTWATSARADLDSGNTQGAMQKLSTVIEILEILAAKQGR